MSEITRAGDIKYPFPSDWIDPALKGKPQYSLDYARAAYQLYMNDNCVVTLSRRNDYIINRLYAEGLQDNTKYKKWNSIQDDTGQWVSYVDLDYMVVSPIQKYRDIVMELMNKRSYDIVVDAIDPYSEESREVMKFDMWAKTVLNGILEKQQIALEGGIEEEILPQTREELEIFNAMGGFKLPVECAIQSVVDLSFQLNDWPETAKKVREDLFDNGIAGVREYINRDGKHIVRYVDPVNLFVIPSRKSDYKDSTCIGEMIEMMVSDLYAEAGDQFTREQYKDIVNKCANKFGNPNVFLSDFVDTDSAEFRQFGFLGRFGSYKIRVFDVTWFTVDEDYYQKRENESGQALVYKEAYGYEVKDYIYFTEGEGEDKRYFKKQNNAGVANSLNNMGIEISKGNYYQETNKQKNGKKRSVLKGSCQMVYGTKWITGTDYVYDFGKTTDMPREKTDLSKTELPYKVYRLGNKSYVERMMPFADLYMRSWLKLQNAIAKARPKGIQVEIKSLENMTIAGKEFTPLQSLALYDATGNIIYSGTGTYGDPTRHSPVQELTGGMGAEFSELIGAMNFAVQSIRDVTGFNELFDASTPNPKQSVEGAKMALSSSNNALGPLMSAFENIHVRAAKSAALRFQIMSKFGKLKGYEQAISSAKRKIIEISEDCSMASLGIAIVSRPTEEQKAEIKTAAIQAMNTRDAQGVPQITYADYLFVCRVLEGGNLKMAEAILAYRIQKRSQEQQAIAQKNSEMNGQLQQQSIEAQAAAAKEQAAMNTDLKIKEINASAQAQIMIDNNKLSQTKDIEIIKAGSKERQSSQKDSTDVAKKVIESQTAIEKEHLKGHYGKENKKEAVAKK